MKKEKKDALRGYRDAISDVIGRFDFDHHAVIDKDGVIVTPQGFARPFYHKKTNTVGLVFSKTANNLRGENFGAQGQNFAKTEDLERSYIIHARRLQGDCDAPIEKRKNKHNNEREMRKALDIFCAELGRRNQKHFTGFMAGDVFTNGVLKYHIIKRRSDRFDVMLRLPTRRKDGSFVPFDLDDKNKLRNHFAKVSLTVAKTATYEQARLAMQKHWGMMSSDLWDEKNIFNNKGGWFKTKKLAADVFNTTYDHAFTFGLTTLAIGGGTTAIKPELGLIGGVAGALAHAATHIAVEKSIDGATEVRAHRKTAEAKKKHKIDAYAFDKDVSDHFKIQCDENIAKLCPHIDLGRFPAEEFEWLNLKQFNMLRDREQVHQNLKDTCLAGHLLFMHQRGFSSTCSILDDKTELRLFQSGVVRLMHEKEDGNIVVFGQYRPDLCLNEKLRLPEHYIEQFKDGIVRVEYDRRGNFFFNSLIKDTENVAFADMIKEVEGQFLFRDQPIVPWEVNRKSRQALYNSFINEKSFTKPDIHTAPPMSPDYRAMKFQG